MLALAFLLVCTDLRTCVVIENQALENKFNRNIVVSNATTSDIGKRHDNFVLSFFQSPS